jgi:hypothetical protein
MTEGTPSFAEYHRQGMACLAMARLSDVPGIQARWLMFANTWFRLAEKTTEQPASEPCKVIPLRWGM